MYVFSLFYSNSILEDSDEQDLLEQIKKLIKEDKVLKKSIHLICIDNNYVRDYMKTNLIYYWPIFVVKRPDQCPMTYDIKYYKQILDEAKQVYFSF